MKTFFALLLTLSICLSGSTQTSEEYFDRGCVMFAGQDYRGAFALNIGQTSHLPQSIIKSAPAVLGGNKSMSLYDFYIIGTRMLHPETAETTAVWPSNRMWGDFLVNHFNLNN